MTTSRYDYFSSNQRTNNLELLFLVDIKCKVLCGERSCSVKTITTHDCKTSCVVWTVHRSDDFERSVVWSWLNKKWLMLGNFSSTKDSKAVFKSRWHASSCRNFCEPVQPASLHCVKGWTCVCPWIRTVAESKCLHFPRQGHVLVVLIHNLSGAEMSQVHLLWTARVRCRIHKTSSGRLLIIHSRKWITIWCPANPI